MYEFVKEYPRFNLWYHKAKKYYECFWKDIDPNKGVTQDD